MTIAEAQTQLPERFPRLVVQNAASSLGAQAETAVDNVAARGDVIRVPSRSDEYGRDDGSERIIYKRRRRNKFGADRCFDVLQAGPGEGVVQAFPVGYSDARALALRQKREKEEGAANALMQACMRDSPGCLTEHIRHAEKLADIQLVEEEDGRVLLRCVGPDDRVLDLCVQDGGSGRLFVVRSALKYVKSFIRLTRERPSTFIQLMMERQDEEDAFYLDGDVCLAGENSYQPGTSNLGEDDLIPVDDKLNEKLKASINIERLFDWDTLRQAQQQGQLTWTVIRDFIRDVQIHVPFISCEGLLSRDKYQLSFHQFVAFGRLLEDHIKSLARTPAKLLGHTLEVTHCSAKVVIQSDRPCSVVAVAAASTDAPPSSANLKGRCFGCLLASQRVEIDDDGGEVTAEIVSLQPGTDYYVYFFGEHSSGVEGDQRIVSSDADLFRTRLYIRTRTEPEPPLFPMLIDMDDEARSTELLAVIKDKRVRKESLRSGVQVPEVGSKGSEINWKDKGWVLFVEWWALASDVRMSFCEREVKNALRDEDVQDVAAREGVLCEPGDWNAREPERLRKWKRFCRWYYGISSEVVGVAAGKAKTISEHESNMAKQEGVEPCTSVSFSSYAFPNESPPAKSDLLLEAEAVTDPEAFPDESSAAFPFTHLSVKRRERKEEVCLAGNDTPDYSIFGLDSQPFDAIAIGQEQLEKSESDAAFREEVEFSSPCEDVAVVQRKLEPIECRKAKKIEDALREKTSGGSVTTAFGARTLLSDRESSGRGENEEKGQMLGGNWSDNEQLKDKEQAGGTLDTEAENVPSNSKASTAEESENNRDRIKQAKADSFQKDLPGPSMKFPATQAVKRPKQVHGMRNAFLLKRTQQINIAVEKVEEMIRFTSNAKELKGIALFRSKARIVAVTQKLNKLKEKANGDATSASEIANLSLFDDFDENDFVAEEKIKKKVKRTPLVGPTSTKRKPVSSATEEDKEENAMLRRKLAELRKLKEKQLVRRCFRSILAWRGRRKLLREHMNIWLVWKTNRLLLRRCFDGLVKWEKPAIEETLPEPEPQPIQPVLIVEEGQIDHEEQVIIDEPDEDLEQERIEREMRCLAEEDIYSNHHRNLAKKIAAMQFCEGPEAMITSMEPITHTCFPAFDLKQVLDRLVALSGEKSGLEISDFEYEQEYAEMIERRKEFAEMKGRSDTAESDAACGSMKNASDDEDTMSLSQDWIESVTKSDSDCSGNSLHLSSEQSLSLNQSSAQSSTIPENQGEELEEVSESNIEKALKAWHQFAVTGMEIRAMTLAEAECLAFCKEERSLQVLAKLQFQAEDKLSQEWEGRERRRLNHRIERFHKYGLTEQEYPGWGGTIAVYEEPQAKEKHCRLKCHHQYTTVNDPGATILFHPEPDLYHVKQAGMKRLLSKICPFQYPEPLPLNTPLSSGSCQNGDVSFLPSGISRGQGPHVASPSRSPVILSRSRDHVQCGKRKGAGSKLFHDSTMPMLPFEKRAMKDNLLRGAPAARAKKERDNNQETRTKDLKK